MPIEAAWIGTGELVNWKTMFDRAERILAPLSTVLLLWAAASPAVHGSSFQDPRPKPESKPRSSAEGRESKVADPEDLRLLAEELRQDALMIRRGEARKAVRSLEEILGEKPENAEARLLLAEARFEEAEFVSALAEAERALVSARSAAAARTSPGSRAIPGERPLELRCVRVLARTLLTVGRSREALDVLEKAAGTAGGLTPESDAQDAWALGSALWETGQRPHARKVLAMGAKTPDDPSWQSLLARGECQRRLGDLEVASNSFVAADEASQAEEGSSEPDVLSALGDLYFEADREVEAGRRRSAADLYKDALKLAPAHERSLLGLYRLHRTNWLRHSRTAQDVLDELLAVKPNSIEGGIAGASADLDDGQLKSCRERISELEKVAPGRREVRTLRAALAWVEHREAECEKLLADLFGEDPTDATPEREVGRHLSELYRFAEALPFESRATTRDEHDGEA